MVESNSFSGNLRLLLLVVIVLVTILLAFIAGGPTSAVDWSDICAVAFESDDWGLAGFTPQSGLWQDLDRSVLNEGPAFPEVYWESTLEDSSMVANLCNVLAKYQGADGVPPVFQPNYVMSSLEWIDSGTVGIWQQYDLPDFPTQYSRQGMWDAVRTGINKGLWYPEFHAAFHYDAKIRKRDALLSSQSRAITETGILLFPRSELAWELGPWRANRELDAELTHSLDVFKKIFNRYPGSIIAPDYTWNENHERMWQQHGLVVIQAKREQRIPYDQFNLINRVEKVLSRRFGYVFQYNRTYLERNCGFETVQRADWENPQAMAEMVTQTVQRTIDVWQKGQPAIVETHRINFSHTNPEVVAIGLDLFDSYLNELLSDDQGEAVFLVDMEIAQLYRHGTSICLRGETVIVRNATHSRKVVGISPKLFSNSGIEGGAGGKTKFIMVGPDEVIQIPSVNLIP